jgi:hypothetical protein
MTLFYAATQHFCAALSIIVQLGAPRRVCTIVLRVLLLPPDNLSVEYNVDLMHQLEPLAAAAPGMAEPTSA